MQIGILSEPSDNRVALVPDIVEQLVAAKNSVWVESGAGAQSFISDQQFESAGANGCFPGRGHKIGQSNAINQSASG